MLHDILGHDHLQWYPPLIRKTCDLVTKQGLIVNFDLITKFQKVCIEHLQRVRLTNRGRLLIWTPGPVPFGTCISSNNETILS